MIRRPVSLLLMAIIALPLFNGCNAERRDASSMRTPVSVKQPAVVNTPGALHDQERFRPVATGFRGIRLGDSIKAIASRVQSIRGDPNLRYLGQVGLSPAKYGHLANGRDYFGTIAPFTTPDGTIDINPSFSATLLDNRLVALEVSYLFVMPDLTRQMAYRSLVSEELRGLRAWALSDSATVVQEPGYAYRLEIDTSSGYGVVSYEIWYPWFKEDFKKMFGRW